MITRRTFAKSLAGSLALTSLAPSHGRARTASSKGEAAAALYRDAFVLDANTLASFGLQFAGEDERAMVADLRESGLTAFKSTLGGATGTFEEAVADVAAADGVIETRPDLFLKVRTAGDLTRAAKERKVGVIYSFEAASPLGDKVERVELFRRLGVRVMQLTYNRSTPFGVGCLDGEAGGLTALGREAIAKMNELGVAVDLSHSNTQTTAEGIAASTRPPVVTHAGCRAVFMHPRNKADREMRALADKGGVMGIYMLPYLTASPKQPLREDFVRHVEHALDVCGEDHVGVGSDVPFQRVEQADIAGMMEEMARRKAAGIGAPGEDRPLYIPDLNTPRKMELVAAALLARGHSRGVVEKVLGANFRRVFGEIWAA
jgi:membrane dipeptidase